MAQLTFDLVDDRTGLIVNVTVTEEGDGTLTFDLEVVDDTGVIGDLNGLFFNMLDGGLVDGLTVTGDDVSKVNLDEDSVTKVDSYNNINGEVKAEYGKFDAGIQFGTSGMAADDIQTTTFTLSHTTEFLTLDQFFSQSFAVRLTSVGEEDGSRDDSLKIGGTAGDTPVVEDPVNEDPVDEDPVNEDPVDEDPVDEDPVDEDPVNEDPVDENSVNLATDNDLYVTNTETFDGRDTPDGVLSVLEDDTTDGLAYQGVVVAANGVDLPVTDEIDFVEVSGSNGGLLRVYEDGTVDFSANDAPEFEGLSIADEPVVTEFTYTIEGGDTATIRVHVSGETDEGIGDDEFFEEEFTDGGVFDEPLSDFG